MRAINTVDDLLVAIRKNEQFLAKLRYETPPVPYV